MTRLKQTSFTQAERDELFQKAKVAFQAQGINKILVTGSSNITYLSRGIVFPYIDQALVHPVALYICYQTNRQILSCTVDLSDIPNQLGWQGEILIYELTEATPEQSLAVALAQHLANDEVTGKTIGYDFEFMSGAQLAAFEASFPAHQPKPADATLRTLRMQKTDAEVRLLEISARMGDRGFISALNHAEGAALDTLSYPMWEYGERFRVHVAEFGGSGVGNLAIMRGERCRHLYGATGTRELFTSGEFNRMEYSVHSYGYWHTGARTVFEGYPDDSAKNAWANNLRLKQSAIDALVAGNKASDVYKAVVQTSEATGINFWRTGDIGHGVGSSEREAPFLALYDETELAPNMVIVVAVYTFNEKQQLIVNKDTYLITDGQPQLLTWYKKWDRLYALYGTSARHG